jgi:hypothetical protein
MFINQRELNDNIDNEVDVTTAEFRVNETESSANQSSSFASAGIADIHMYWSNRNKVPAGFLRLSKWMETRGRLRNEEG